MHLPGMKACELLGRISKKHYATAAGIPGSMGLVLTDPAGGTRFYGEAGLIDFQ